MTFDDFIGEFSNDELFELAQAISNNEVSAPNELELRDLLEDVPMEDRQDAADEKSEIIRLLNALGLEFRFREELEGGSVTLTPGDEEEPDVRVEEVDEPEPEPRPRQPAREPPDLTPDEAARARRGARPDPGELIRRDTSRISNAVVRRDLGLEFLFFDLLRDLGRCDQFPCSNPDNYFRLTPDEQRKFYDFTLEGTLRWLVRRGETTPNTLRKRGFPDDVIPDEGDDGGAGIAL